MDYLRETNVIDDVVKKTAVHEQLKNNTKLIMKTDQPTGYLVVQ